MKINTTDLGTVKSYLQKLHIPEGKSHKGQNGRVVVIGGSKLFHSASIWAAEIASHFADIVHYCSTEENNEIMQKLKTLFRNGIVIHKSDILEYALEDDAILIGPGMMREQLQSAIRQPADKLQNLSFANILELENEADYAKELTHFLLLKFPEKKFVIDAGALQMLDPEVLKKRSKNTILTPHQLEFYRVFGIDLSKFDISEKTKIVQEKAKQYNCTILLKAVSDIVSDGKETIVVGGGNQGLTKGGTGDILAGLTLAFFATNDPLQSAVSSSLLEKTSAEFLAQSKGIWYNTSELLDSIPAVFARLIYNKN